MLAAFVLGVVSGMRTFTGIAALSFARGGLLAIASTVAALGEYVLDLFPSAPSRLTPIPLVGRIGAGIAVGALVARTSALNLYAVTAIGVVGALVGAFGGAALRRGLIARLGPIPAGLVEDALAIGLAWVAVTRLV